MKFIFLMAVAKFLTKNQLLSKTDGSVKLERKGGHCPLDNKHNAVCPSGFYWCNTYYHLKEECMDVNFNLYLDFKIGTSVVQANGLFTSHLSPARPVHCEA